MNEKFTPKVDRLFVIVATVTVTVLLLLTSLTAIDATFMLLYTLPVDLFVTYFLISPLFGYVEMREECLFIKFGFIMKREIPYEKIRGTVRERKFYSDSMTSLKNAMDHVNVKYNTFDMVSLSLNDSETFIKRLEERIKN